MLTLMAIAIAIALIFVIVCLTRNDSVPIFIRKLNAQGRTPLDPSVAFENPGYGTEVQVYLFVCRDRLNTSFCL